MSKRDVYLHVGLHKTGTTYLQGVLAANRAQLADQDVFFPGGSGGLVQRLAVWDLVGRRPRGTGDRRVAGQWQRLVRAVDSADQPTTLISVEYLSLLTTAQARRAVEAFGASNVHVLVTARDLGRVLVSSWQEAIKNDQTWTWRQFIEAVGDPDARAQNPARTFWQQQDLPAVLETWRGAVPADRIHVVAVPAPGADSQLLLQRFCQVVGLDPAGLTADARWTNTTIGVVGVEVVRRVNQRLDNRLNQRQHDHVVKRVIGPALRPAEAERVALPPGAASWIADESRRMVAGVRAGGYDVVGDLAELEPQLDQAGRRPDDATTEELLEAALDALAGLAEQHAATWWAQRDNDGEDGTSPASGGSRVGSAARGARFRAQRKGAELADRNRVAAGAMRVYLRARSARRRSAAS